MVNLHFMFCVGIIRSDNYTFFFGQEFVLYMIQNFIPCANKMIKII